MTLRHLLAAWACLAASNLCAQSAPTTNVLYSMTLARSSHGYATIFSIDVDHREYWITAKHVLTGAKHPPYGTVMQGSVSLDLLDSGIREERWSTIRFSVIDAGKDIDIVALAPTELLLKSAEPSVPANFVGILLGGDCEFIGYPAATRGIWGAMRSDGNCRWMPFVKHCFISSLPMKDNPVVILDGVNNPGFSGGPVVYRTGTDQQIIAVISGIVTEPSDVVLPALEAQNPTQEAAQRHKQKVDTNAGFIVAYSINPAVEASQ